MGFLHGIETIVKDTAPKPVRGVKTAVVAIVGTAPVHHQASQSLNEPALLLSDVDDAAVMGPNLAGYTLPRALELHRSEGTGIVIAINVFDPTSHKEDVVAADLDIEDGAIQLANPDVISVVVKAEGGAGDALIEGTDYAIDRVTGLITALAGGALAAADAANVAYSYGDPSAVLAADVIGEVDGNGVRSGLQALLNTMTLFGFNAKILEVPGYSTAASVVAALNSMATKLRAVAFVDAPIATSLSVALAGRGPAGAINFNVASSRVGLCFPHAKAYQRSTDSTVLTSLATLAAAATAVTDQTQGFWFSPSNYTFKTVTGIEIPIQFAINDETAEANQLNAAGICTIANAFGTGFRFWGNRSSLFPGSSDVMTFFQAQRTADQIHESIELSMLPYIDKPISSAVIDAILESANGYMNLLIQRGAVPPGSRVLFEKAKNPPSEIQLGHLTFTQVWAPAPPLERLTFESVVDVSLLANLLPQ